MMILCIDDSPGRFDEFSQIISRDHPDVRWVVACHPLEVEALLPRADAILLDHDMPYRDGREWAKFLVQNIEQVPVVIVSTSGTPGVREEMAQIFRDGGWNVKAIYADHHGCEAEWLAWCDGAISQKKLGSAKFKYTSAAGAPEGQLLRGTPGSAGMDVRSAQEAWLFGGEPAKTISTGLFVEIPVGYVGLLVPRSGLARNFGISILNSPGIIDSDYRGELEVLMYKRGNGSMIVNRGDRIAQLLIVPISMAQPVWVEELSPAKTRTGGFGSTGVG